MTIVRFDRSGVGLRAIRLSKPSTGDLVAGLSVALIAVPQSLAYAEIAGLPAQYGLFASALPPLIAALFVSSKYLQTGPVALTALLTFGALSTVAEPFSDRYIGLAALLALLVGVIRAGLGLLKLGRVAYLLSEPVLLGFTTAAAVLILTSQLPKVFGAAPGDGGVLGNAFRATVEVGRWEWGAIGFGLLTAAFTIGGRRIHRLFPGVLAAVVVAVIISVVIGYDGSTVGRLQGGFVSVRVDFPWRSTTELLLPAVIIALVGFAEPASIARTFAAEERLDWDANREMVSQGVANLASGLSGAFPVGGSFSRSSLNRLAGADSAWAGAVTGFLVLISMPLTPLLEPLPSAVLGAIVIVAVLKLVKFSDMVRMLGQSSYQGIAAAGTFVATLATSPRVERGVLIGIVLSIIVHLLREMVVTIESERSGHRLTIAPAGVLWFATVPLVESLIRHELAEHHDVTTIVFDLGGVGRLDFSGGASLARLIDDLESRGHTVEVIEAGSGSTRAVGIHMPSKISDQQRPPAPGDRRQ